MAKLSTLQDSFSGALNTSLWTPTGTVDTTGGTLNVALTDPDSSVISVSTYDATDSSIFFEMVVDATATDDDWPFVGLDLISTSTAGYIGVDYYSRNGVGDPILEFSAYDPPRVNFYTSVAYDGAAMAWIRIRLSGTSIIWETSADGLTWDAAASTTTTDASSFTSVNVFTEVRWGSYAGTSAPTGVAHFDEINLAPTSSSITAILSAGAGMDAALPNVTSASLSAGGGLDGTPAPIGPGATFLFGMSGTGVTTGAVDAALPDTLGIGSTTNGTTLAGQTSAAGIASGSGYDTWNRPLDYAFGGIFPAGGDTWAAAAGGAYTARWRTALTALAASWSPRDYSLLRLRFAHGANASASPWAVSGGEVSAFVDAFRLWADIVADVMPGAQRVLSLSPGAAGLADPRVLWPGRRWADIVAIEAFNTSPHAASSGEVAAKLTATSGSVPIGPTPWLAQAATWGVPLAVVEWGNPSASDAPLWVAAMLDLFQANAGATAGKVTYAIYSNASTTTILPSSGTSAQPSSTAVLTGATTTSSTTGGAVGYVPPSGGAGTSVVIGDNARTYAGPPPPSWPTPGSPGAYAIPSDLLPIKRVSAIYPDPVFVNGRLQADWEPTTVITEDWGYLRVVVDGQDISFFRDGLVIPDSFADEEPFTETTASFTISHCVPTDVPGAGDLTWLRDGASVNILALRMDGSVTSRWAGEIIDFSPSKSDTDWQWTVQCIGELRVGDLTVHKPPTYRDPTDIGTVIADTLNGVVSRPYNVTAATTGILTTKRGSADSSPLDFVQELLSTATTADGLQQWTVMRNSPNNYLVRIKDTTSESFTMHCSQPGISVDLSWDASSAPNVIYARGVGPDGYAWANWVYPGQGDAAPAYPFSAAKSVITLGTTDATTTSGNGVSTWQQAINDLGIAGAKVSVDGVYSAADAAAAKVVQRYYGVQVDGVVGPQTWAATFDVGAAGVDLDQARRLPVAWDPAVEPELTAANGAFVGTSATYDNGRQRREIDLNFGDGVTKAQGVAAAQAFLNREGRPGWAGTITLTADPQENSKWAIVAGQNFRLRGWGSTAGPLLHIAGVAHDVAGDTVTLTVDEKARDLPTLVEIMKRNTENATNPARLPETKQRRSRIQPDAVVEFDGESAGGRVPRTALFGGLWTVLRIPVSQVGTVAKIALTTVSPASEFTVAFFGAPVTAAQLIAHVGSSPLTARSDHFGPYDWHYDQLIALGFQEAIGGPNQAAGYDPGYQTSPITGGTTPLTGRLISTGSWTYQSVRPPWLWVAFWAKSSCFISGRIYPQAIDL